MVDFVKFQIIGMLPEALGMHPDLTFISSGESETGELNTSVAYADYKGLRFLYIRQGNIIGRVL